MRQRTIHDKVFFIMTKLKYKTTAINNRRYLGNKYRLLLFITQTIGENLKSHTTGKSNIHKAT